MRQRFSTVVLLVLMLGCFHRTPAPKPESTGEPAALHYSLELVRTPFMMVKVILQTRGAADGKTLFDAGESWGGVERPEDEVHGLAVRGEDGRAVAVEHPAGHTWIARHSPGERLTLSYFLVSTRQDFNADSETHYRALIEENLVHLIGETSLIFPAHLDDQTKRRIGLRWSGFAESGWRVVSSFGPGNELEVLETTGAFRHAVFIASSDLRLVSRQLGANTVTLGIVGAWPFADAELAEVAARVVETQRAFFQDPGPGFYLISVIPVGEKRPNSSSMGGTGLTNSFATFLSPGLPLAGELGNRLKWLFGHELFHTWNGQTVRAADPGPLVYWFTEGFTNFYARRLLHRAGLIPLDAYVDDLNEAVAGYLLSPVSREPNSRILADFWRSEAVQKLPYRRGDMVAYLVDREIRRVSGNKRGLDDFMRELVAQVRTSGERVGTKRLIELIERSTSREFAGEIERIVNDGAIAPIDPKAFGPCLAGELRSLGRFDLGFDFNRSKQSYRVVGVEPGSSASLAGLRDGQSLTGWSVHGGEPEEKVEFTVREGGEERKIRYLPQGPAVPVPRFAVGDPAACASQGL